MSGPSLPLVGTVINSTIENTWEEKKVLEEKENSVILIGETMDWENERQSASATEQNTRHRKESSLCWNMERRRMENSYSYINIKRQWLISNNN